MNGHWPIWRRAAKRWKSMTNTGLDAGARPFCRENSTYAGSRDRLALLRSTRQSFIVGNDGRAEANERAFWGLTSLPKPVLFCCLLRPLASPEACSFLRMKVDQSMQISDEGNALWQIPRSKILSFAQTFP